MTTDQESNTPKTSPGPVVDNAPTTISTFSAQQLRGSPFLPGLLKTINAAYFQAEQSKPELGFGKTQRLSSINELFVNLRQDPESFLVVLSHADSYDVLATATCRRYFGPDPSNESPWVCSHAMAGGVEEWELKLLAADPTYQGRGLGAAVLEVVEKEVVGRALQKQKVDHDPALKTVKMVLCTVKELLREFYIRKGYCSDYVHQRDEGYNFSIEFFSKVLVHLSQ